jgi:stage II sporulation protein R
VNRGPRRTALVALMAAFVWTLGLRPALPWAAAPAQGSAARPAAGTPSRATPEARRQGVLRLHILANSDTGADQAAKLAVRAAILPVVGAAVSHAASVDAAERALRTAAPAVAATARRTLRLLGRPYGARVVVGDAYFPAKRWGGVDLGPGVYPAVTVILGRGEGQNWWCVLFPNLCVVNPLAAEFAGEPASAREVLLGRSPPRSTTARRAWWQRLLGWL